MADHPILLPAPMLALVRSGRKTQLRRLAASPLAACRPGDLLWVQEAFAPLRAEADGKLRSATPAGAAIAMMKDGWHQHRDGRGGPGPRDYSDGSFHRIRWAPAMKMPRWASRTTLIVAEARVERLQAITREDAVAEGLTPWPPVLGGLWRWPAPHHRRLFRSSVTAFRWLWDTTRGTPGERWMDDPEVVVVRFAAEPMRLHG